MQHKHMQHKHMQHKNIIWDIIIIGAGTAGLSAAIYARRAGRSVLVLEEDYYGGQIVNAPHIENYPAIKEMSGFDFAQALYEQALNLGAEVVFEKVLSFKNTETAKAVATKEKEYPCRSIIVATGAKHRVLGLFREKELTGKGVSYCAACDGAFFKGRTVAVYGGGNTALQDALYLAEECREVYLIHRRNEYRAEQGLQEKVKRKSNILPLPENRVTELLGEEKLNGIVMENTVSFQKQELAVDGLFVAIGYEPDNKRFEDMITLDEAGYVAAGEDCHTNMGGVFAAGDCRTKKIRQLVTAASDGAVAALAACAYIG